MASFFFSLPSFSALFRRPSPSTTNSSTSTGSPTSPISPSTTNSPPISEASNSFSPSLIFSPLPYSLALSLVLSLSLPSFLSSPLLFYTFSSNGPLLMKFGQFLSTRSDILPRTLCDSLSSLQAKAPSFPPHLFRKIFLTELGADPNSLLRVEGVIGSGCVSQVYKIRIREREFAMKVIDPTVRKRLSAELKTLSSVLCLAGLGEVAREFSRSMKDQLDLRIEMENTKKFIRNFDVPYKFLKSLPLIGRIPVWGERRRIVFPRPYLASESILISEYVPKTSLSPPKKEILTVFLKMVFRDGFVHTDLHPGNVGMTRNSDIVIYDSGLALSLTEERRRNLLDLSLAIIEKDPRRAALLIIERNKRTRRVGEEEREGFIRDAEGVLKGLFPLASGSAKGGGMLRGLLEASRRRGIALDEGYTTLLWGAGLLI